MTDKAIHDGPHCHAPIHPAAPVPTPVPHPPVPLDIVLNCVPTVMINNMQAAVVTSMTKPCMLASCVPAGPGMVGKGSATVLIGGLPAAVLGDNAVCVGPPDAIVKGSATVMIGGRPAARLGDTTAHGGAIVLGLPTVMIGG
jgi:uncharacterized Zn-binding protein involved in type VI secretion